MEGGRGRRTAIHHSRAPEAKPSAGQQAQELCIGVACRFTLTVAIERATAIRRHIRILHECFLIFASGKISGGSYTLISVMDDEVTVVTRAEAAARDRTFSRECGFWRKADVRRSSHVGQMLNPATRMSAGVSNPADFSVK